MGISLVNHRHCHDTHPVAHRRSTRTWYLTFEHYGRLVEVAWEHQAIVEAIAAGDADKAEAAMREHIVGFQNQLSRMLQHQSTKTIYIPRKLAMPQNPDRIGRMQTGRYSFQRAGNGGDTDMDSR